MQSFLHAYQAFEQRSIRGEFPAQPPRSRRDRFPLRLVLEASLGDIMIRVGIRLKAHALTGKSMSWSPLTGSKA